MKGVFLSIVLFCGHYVLQAQFAPPATHSGSTAIHKDSAILLNWAKTCTLNRGYMDISQPLLGKASSGEESFGTGKSGSNGVVSLGDAGVATLSFNPPIKNGQGFDFAVFENGFNYSQTPWFDFLELAHVEVSSDGLHYYRFASSSLTDTTVQLPSYAGLEASKLNNLAGKYVWPYGTPFDLEELANNPFLDINNIVYVRLIDVVGSVDASWGSRDAAGRIICDPWPTGWATGGFDLDAVGVIHQQKPNGSGQPGAMDAFEVYPNPVQAGQALYISRLAYSQAPYSISLYTMDGRLLYEAAEGSNAFTMSWPAGLYLLQLKQEGTLLNKKILVK